MPSPSRPASLVDAHLTSLICNTPSIELAEDFFLQYTASNGTSASTPLLNGSNFNTEMEGVLDEIQGSFGETALWLGRASFGFELYSDSNRIKMFWMYGVNCNWWVKQPSESVIFRYYMVVPFYGSDPSVPDVAGMYQWGFHPAFINGGA